MFGTDEGKEASAAVPLEPAATAGEEALPGEADTAEADFEPGIWDPADRRYGMVKLLELREAMMPIVAPEGVKFIKYLHFPGHGVQDDDGDERERRSENRRSEGAGDRGKGKGKSKRGQERTGRFIQEMGQTELQKDYVKGQWWRNISDELPVIVRSGFSLMSPEVWKVPPGSYVQQSGPAEIFVSGQAKGLVRMPIGPSGWVTVDASSVGGPKYLSTVPLPRWKVFFKSDTPKGDVLVRSSVSLESGEVACIYYGSLVIQSGPQETLEDGIIRMPITWEDQPSSGSGAAPKKQSGWVTCDASSQGGPQFFCAAPLDEAEPPTTAAGEARQMEGNGRDASNPTAAAANDRRGPDGFASWDKNRLWKVGNLEPGKDRSLPLVTHSDPYAPGTGRVPPEDMLVRWLVNGDVLEQIGHSKKTRGYMVMPVRLIRDAKGDEVKSAEGWVTRRLVDKQRDNSDQAWLIEVRDGDEESERERRRAARREARG